MPPRLRIFLSSPGDVNRERLRAHLIIQKLARNYARFFAIESYLWEYEPMLASGHFQDTIDPPSGFDILLLILWSRLGTPLPVKTSTREYRGIDNRTPVTGTEWEFEDALRANREHGGVGPPDLLAYRCDEAPMVPLDDAAMREEKIAQYDALEAFWGRWFKNGQQFLAGYAHYHTLDEFDRRLEADLSKLIEKRIRNRRETPGRIWLSSPFRGLESYNIHDGPIFFGRDGDIRDGLTRLAEAAGRGTAFLLVSGASGSGKSSLARAGLVSSLVAPKTIDGVGLWRRVVMRPGDAAGDPILALARALVAGDTNKGVGLPELAGKQTSADELAAHLASGGDPSFLFIKALRDLADAERARSAMLAHEQARLVLLVDQLEELFVRPEITTSQRVLFTRLLTGLARSGLVWVIATMRSDWRHRVDELKDLRDLAEGGGRLALLPPSPAQLLEMIRQPVRTSGLEFEKDPDSGLFLDALLVQEAGTDPGVLPHLSVLLDNLYRRDIHDGDSAGLLTVASYRSLVPAAMGGLRSSIGHHAERVIKELESADPEAAHVLPRLLRALIGGGKSGAETNRPVLRSTFPEQGSEQRLIEVLLAPNARLLTAEDRGDGAEIRLAHEALIQNWPRARTIITESANFLRVRDELEAQRRKWQAAHRRGEFLLARGLPLAEAESLVGKFSDEVSPHVRAFVKASRARANRGQMIAWGVAMVFASIACGALWQWRLATQAAKLRIGTDVREKLARAAFLVESSDRGALATAFPVGSHMLATAAHVVDSIASVAPGEKLFIRSPGQNGKTYEIVNYKVHPGSVALRNVVSGDAARRAAAQLDLDGYDFGLLYVKEELPAEARLEIAPPSELKMLQPGAVIAMAGYPVEGISGSRSQVLGPTPELHMGSITSFTDFFFLPAEFANAKLIHHDLPAVGGGSGSPIVSYTGHIVGMLTGGNTYSPGGDQPRAPSAALVNYAHRADVLQNLMQGSADAEVATDRSYWEEQLRKFRSGPDIIADLIRREIVAKDKNLTLTRLTELTEVLNTQSQAADSSGGVQRQSRRTVRTPAGADYLIVAYAYDRTALTVSVQNGDQVVGESRRHSYFSSVRVQTLVEGVLTVSINCSCDRDIRYSFQVLSVQPSR